MRDVVVPDRVIEWVLSQRNEFGADELADATGLSHRSASIYLSRLERKGMVIRRRKGRYDLHPPKPSRHVLRFARMFLKELPLTEVVVWSTDTIVHYSHYLPIRHLIFVETAKENVPALHDVLKEHGVRALVRPTRTALKGAYEDGTDVVVLARRDRYGTRPWKGKVSFADLERVFVDLHALSSRKGLPFPEEEVLGALGSALAENAVSRSALRKYSKRRYVYADLRECIEGRP